MGNSSFNQYLLCNSVSDYTPNNMKYILVCESPHTAELKYDLPLCGKAGKNILNRLGISYNVGLGKYLSDNSITTIGIMNICNAPLQNTRPDNQSEFDFQKFKKVRAQFNYLLHHRDNSINSIEEEIISDFRNRFKKVIYNNQSVIFAVCGKFAQKYIDYIIKSYNNSIQMINMPHPARNKWVTLNIEQNSLIDKFMKEIQSNKHG